MEGDITYAREHRKQVRKALNRQKRGLPQRVFRGLLDETPQTPEQTLGDFAEEYLRWKKGTGKDTERDRYCFAHLVAVLGDKRLPDMTREDVHQYITRRLVEGAKPNTVQRELVVLKAALNKAKSLARGFTVPGSGKPRQRR